jgi:hypothetical protein
MILVELSSVAVWWTRKETLHSPIFKRRPKKYDLLLLYQPFYMNHPQRSANDDNYKSTITSAVKHLYVVMKAQ